MLRDGLLLFYCATVGFVAAGFAASLYKLITQEAPRFRLLGQGWLATFVTYFFCAITGPAIVLDLVIHNRVNDRTAIGTMFAGLFVAALWSLCSGMVVLEVVLQVKDGLA